MEEPKRKKVSEVAGPEVDVVGGPCCGSLKGGSCVPLKLERFGCTLSSRVSWSDTDIVGTYNYIVGF